MVPPPHTSGTENVAFSLAAADDRLAQLHCATSRLRFRPKMRCGTRLRLQNTGGYTQFHGSLYHAGHTLSYCTRHTLFSRRSPPNCERASTCYFTTQPKLYGQVLHSDGISTRLRRYTNTAAHHDESVRLCPGTRYKVYCLILVSRSFSNKEITRS